MSNSDILQYALSNGIINLDDVRKDIMNEENKKLIEKHPYKIWVAKDGYWKSHVFDENKKNERRQISSLTKSGLNEKIIKEYNIAQKKSRESQKKYDLKSLYAEWLNDALETKELVKGTIDRYNNDWDKFYEGTDFARMDIRAIKQADIVQFLKGIVCGREDDNKLTRKCFSNIKTVIIGIFGYAKTDREIECLPIHQVLEDIKISSKQFKKTVKKDSEQVFTDEEAVLMGDYIINNHKTTRDLGVLLALLTGLRIGELCTLKKSDQDGFKLYINRTEVKEKDDMGKTIIKVREFPKTEESMNAITLSDSAYIVLDMIKKMNLKNDIKTEYLFYDPSSGRIKSRAFDKKLRRICNNVGIPQRSMHKLRKTYTSILFANGVEEKIVQSQMRHKDSKTTHEYYEFFVRSQEYARKQLKEADIFRGKIIPMPLPNQKNSDLPKQPKQNKCLQESIKNA